MNNGQPSNTPRRSRQAKNSKNVFTTKSGNDIRVNRSFSDKRRARKDAIARQRAARLSSLPKNRFKRILYRLHPKRVVKYWFSREGAIMALKITGVGIVVCFLLLVGMFAYFRKDLPNITDVTGNNLPGSISYYDRTGQTLLWQDYDAVKRVPVAPDKINENMKNATIAIEDRGFYKEGAFNVRGIARAAYQDVFGSSDTIQGGSTITQQLVKLNENWTNDRTISRKIKEIILAVELEREYSKADIIGGYLKVAPYGGIEVGVESAARDYFGTTAQNLTLAQASMLAAIPQAPSYYSPYAADTFDKDKLIGRQHYILDQMVDQKMVTQQQADEAKKVDIVASVKPLQQKYSGIKAPYFVLAAKDELERTYLTKTTTLGGWKINTSLNMDLQTVAEEQVAKGITQVKRQGGDDAAFVAEDVKTGEIVASVGGPDFNNEVYGKLNFAHSVQVSPGSTFKPYDYTTLLDKGNNVGAGSVLYDQQGALPGYPCTKKGLPPPKGDGNCLWDYDFKYPGPITLRYALGGSRNVPAVKAMLTVGTDKTISTANALMAKDGAYKCYAQGTDVFSATKADESQCYGSSAIGDGAYLHLDDHVNGFASLSRLGSAMPNTYIHSISDAKGKPVALKKREAKQVVRPDAAYILDDMASDPKASYLPASNICNGLCKFHSYNGWKFAIKTGTTNDGFDGLMASWSTQYAAVTWVGYHTRTKAMTGNMETMTAPIVRNWMQAAHDKLNTKAVNWTAPAGIKTLPAFVVRNHIGVGSVEPSGSNDIFPSWYQPKTASSGSTVIDKVSNKVATDCTPDAAKQTVGGGNANTFSVDQFIGGGAANTTATDDVHKCDDQKPNVGLVVSSNSTGSATDICTLAGCTITATVTQGTQPIASDRFPGKLSVTINGTAVKSFDITGTDSPQTFSFQYTPEGSGSAAIVASVSDSVLYSGSATSNVTFQTDTPTVPTPKPKNGNNNNNNGNGNGNNN
jgi:membrane peptidoglycan carboxypeptidase